MRIDAALRAGQRVRHCDWLPYHFAEFRPTATGELKLHKITPAGDATPLDVNLELLDERDGWVILDDRVHPSNVGQ